MSDRTRGLTDDLPELPNAEIHHDHRDVSGGWLRPTVFGMMDGLVSNFALIAGVAGASSSSSQISLAGLADSHVIGRILDNLFARMGRP